MLEIIKNILDDFGSKEQVFLSESQFQFDLAWELQKKIDKSDKILLEHTAVIEKGTEKSKKKRFQSDIIVQFANSDYIVIELKYKTKANRDDYKVELIQQAGQPGTKYDYLNDIRRIELLKNQDVSKYEYLLKGQCLGGYAIFLTNDNSYWQDKQKGLAKHFSIEDGRTIKRGDLLSWNTDIIKPWIKSRSEFTLGSDYTFVWNDYYDTKKKNKGSEIKFRYLITEV